MRATLLQQHRPTASRARQPPAAHLGGAQVRHADLQRVHRRRRRARSRARVGHKHVPLQAVERVAQHVRAAQRAQRAQSLAQQRDLAAKVAVRLRLRAAHSTLVNAWAQPSDALCSCNPASGAKVRHTSSVSAGTHH